MIVAAGNREGSSWPGGQYATIRARSLAFLGLQLGLILIGYFAIGGRLYPLYPLIASMLVVIAYATSWSLNKAGHDVIRIREQVAESYQDQADQALVSDAISSMASARWNAFAGLIFTAGCISVYLLDRVLPLNGPGFLAVALMTPALFLTGEACYQVIWLLRLISRCCRGKSLQFDRHRPDRVPLLVQLADLHAFATTGFFLVALMLVVVYVAAIQSSQSPSAMRFTYGWALLFTPTLTAFPIIALWPRWMLSMRLRELKQESITEIEAEFRALIAKPRLSAATRVQVRMLSELIIRAIEASSDEVIPVQRLFLPFMANIASVISMLAIMPDTIRRFLNT